ncbi:universal stress protein [Saccharopolyspora griseoalba]|uniref:Universal stress protein n=1 Tax=Saccharopolyspora griseoalba TaxID=1431848 RepID=A0ABW2LL03_9PSEU
MAEGLRDPVVAGFDLSDSSRRAAQWAAGEAARRRRPLLLLHVLSWPFEDFVPIRVPGEEQVTEPLQRALQREMEALRARFQQADPDLVVEVRLPMGDPARSLGEIAAESELLVLGGPKVGRDSHPLGATAVELLSRRSGAPVVVVRGEDSPPDGPVVVGVDGSGVSRRAVGYAFEAAAQRGGELVAVHSWSDVPFNPFDVLDEWELQWGEIRDKSEVVLAEALAGWQEEFPTVEVRRVVTAAEPVGTLLGEARGASLLVVGSHGRGAVRRALLGSVSHGIVNRAPCPVAVVPAK